MKAFLLSRLGVVCLCCFSLLMAVVLQRVLARGLARRAAAVLPVAVKSLAAASAAPTAGVGGRAGATEAVSERDKPPTSDAKSAGGESSPPTGVLPSEAQDNISYLDTTKNLSSRSRVDRDRQGRQVTRRKTARGQAEGRNGEEVADSGPGLGLGVRLKGREPAAAAKAAGLEDASTPEKAVETAAPTVVSEEEQVFCPFGRPIKCELVFTIDSTMEETPLVGLVMEPVYNNGRLVIPAGAELHGVARPDRLRDRIFSGQEWMLIMPRMEGLANGRQLSVQGLALDRVEPDENGLTWGITDGSYGLQGAVMRSLQEEELKRFAATFLSAAAFGLQEREGAGQGRSRLQATPRNAALQGLGTTLEEVARKIGVEIEQHGVFIRVAGGKQFYFYPKQAIFPNRALVPVLARKGGG